MVFIIVMILTTMEQETENLFDEVSKEDHYKTILVKGYFKGNYKYYEGRGDKEKRLSVK